MPKTTQAKRPGRGAGGERYLLISADCHAGATAKDYRHYLERKYLDAYDEYLAAQYERKRLMLEAVGADESAGFRELLKAVGFDPETVNSFFDHEAVSGGGQRGASDPELRLKALEADGIVGDVIFPDSGVEEGDGAPFAAGLGDGREMIAQGMKGKTFDPKLVWAGARAYNRWLADFVSIHPERHAGVALVPLYDMDEAVAEIRWAKEAGLRGGILLSAALPPVVDRPGYNDPLYEPIWATCEELDMPVNAHAGSGVPDYGRRLEATALYASEVSFFAHRPLWFLIWGGVFERHPNLKFVLTESTADWIPKTLGQLDFIYEGPLFAQFRDVLSMKPSEYWARNCYVGATFMSHEESEMRHAIGVDRIMWGSDYPHMEGTWPFTRQSLRKTYCDMPPAEVRLMAGKNAAAVYNFDLDKLRPIADRVGPTVKEIATPLTKVPKGNVGLGFRESWDRAAQPVGARA